MQLARVEIENFRHLGTRKEPLKLDFADSLGRVRDFTLLVGPNTSGKTTILDAIALALGRGVGMACLRPDLKVSPRSIVRRGELNAKVTCWLRFSTEEIAATREIFRLAEISEKVPDLPEVKLTWIYPAPKQPSKSRVLTTGIHGSVYWAIAPTQSNIFTGTHPINTEPNPPGQDLGVIQSEPENGWLLLHGRDQAARLLATGRANWSWLHRVGGVFTFDQERTGLGKSISRQVWNIIHGTSEAARENEELSTTDPRTILIDLALQSLVPSIAASGKVPEEFRRIQETYAHVCAPRRIVGAVRDELDEFDVYFSDGEDEYTYDGLSSGEKNVLLLMIRFVAERMNQSVVLVDELELNQHPLWQRALVHQIQRMGEGNQIIATTHSPYLRGAVAPQAVIDLGSLGGVHTSGAE